MIKRETKETPIPEEEMTVLEADLKYAYIQLQYDLLLQQYKDEHPSQSVDVSTRLVLLRKAGAPLAISKFNHATGEIEPK